MGREKGSNRSDQSSGCHGNIKLPYGYNERNVVSNFIFDWIFFIFAGNVDNYKISNEFEIRPDQTTDCGASCPCASGKILSDI